MTTNNIPRAMGFSGERLEHYWGSLDVVKVYEYGKFGDVRVEKFVDGSCVVCVLGKGYWKYPPERSSSAFSDARAEAGHCAGINRALR